ncbi:HxlR family transcriptional regulator [Microtetraspora sp. NBRC 13810]|uniref:winged helix-turn-helix transcriptional regulator n=1 Tax=Microtetraspora sp. NBRC 13810 TaxID=3030990 RepID=UPI0024A3017C|nr:helix-turn-helix domain-containing protein [Microtetraspora sp. NBRC 13810]GLW08581.1 HxlR family transcriptional regulator [Microtetraspora sp. NBRC 13810]
MTRTSLADVACSIARATDLFGDAWTALIMRDVLCGITRFDDLANDLGISRKILAARLARLVEEGVLARERYQEHPPREHYQATEKGKELYPVLLALMNWGDRWYAGPAGPPARIHHLTCDQDTTPVATCAHCGGPLTVDNTTQLPGPGGRIGPGTHVLGPLIASRHQRRPSASA